MGRDARDNAIIPFHMTTQPNCPSRLLRCTAVVARWALALAVLFWVVVVVGWAVFDGWIVPRIDQYRSQLEARASKVLGVSVHIGRLEAHQDRWLPWVQAHGVRLAAGASQDRPPLELKSVIVTVSMRSLLRLGFEEVVIDSPELDVRRDAQGRITVAGMDMAQGSGDNTAATDWLLSQKAIVVRNGTVRWTDELRGAPELVLSNVDAVLRNSLWRHSMRLDVTPPAAWGERLTVRGRFTDPWLQWHRNNWRQWTGQAYAYARLVDVAQLHQYTNAAEGIAAGRGAVRGWLDVQRGFLRGGVVDIALEQVQAQLAHDLQPLDMSAIRARVLLERTASSLGLTTQGLQFTPRDGLAWPGGNVQVQLQDARGKQPASGSFKANALDVAAIASIANRLPLAPAVRQSLQTYQPQGLIDSLQAQWTGPVTAPVTYNVKVQAQKLALMAQPPGQTQALWGVQGIQTALTINERGGSGTLQIDQGALWLPTIFEDPQIPLDTLSADLRWSQLSPATPQQPARWQVQVEHLRLSNDDAQGQLQAAWHSADHASGTASAPGTLDLSGQLTRADATRVHRYLPLLIPASARHYVRDALLSGSSQQVNFKVKGDLSKLPFRHPRDGEFHIAAQVKDVTYDYVPATLTAPATSAAPAALPWPALSQLKGELVFDLLSMSVRHAQGVMRDKPSVLVKEAQARIPDLLQPVVAVQAQAQGALQDFLTVVRGSAVSQITGHVLDDSTGTGQAQLQLGLQVPIEHVEQTTVRGEVTLPGNDVRLMPEVPLLSQSKGRVQFTHQGFTLQGVQAQALGGPVRIEGGMAPAINPAVPSPVRIQAQGMATVQGLQTLPQLQDAGALLQKASGSANYSLQLDIAQGLPEWLITSSLEGIAVALPAPLNKPAAQAWPLRIQRQAIVPPTSAASGASAPVMAQDRLSIVLKNKMAGVYERAITPNPAQVLRGAWVLGDGAALPWLPTSAQGVTASIKTQQMDVDAWIAAAASMTATPPASPIAGAPSTPAQLAAQQAYLPAQVQLRTDQLSWQGRSLHQVEAHISQQNQTWRVDAKAQELQGYAQYRPGTTTGDTSRADTGAGHLFARLSYLTVPESMLAPVVPVTPVAPAPAKSMPTQLPSMDVVIDRFVVHDKEWGRLAVKAVNLAPAGAPDEWRLNTFNITNLQGQLTATGNWTALGTSDSMPTAATQRRTVLNFGLDITDAGGLLERFGMPGVLRKGQGTMQGQVAWIGSPISPDTASMTGSVHVDVGAGQFLKADPGLAKLLGVLSLQSLPRRLTLDFRDVFSQGFAFDFVRGDANIAQGVASTNNLQMKGVSAAVLMEGRADLGAETQNLRVVVVPEINAMSASLVATAINPVVGLGSFLAQVFLRGPLIEAATQEFLIDGTWDDPRVTKRPRRAGAAVPDKTTPASPANTPPAEAAPNAAPSAAESSTAPPSIPIPPQADTPPPPSGVPP